MVRKRPVLDLSAVVLAGRTGGAAAASVLVCSSAECQASRRQKTQAAWRAANPDYFPARRMTERASQQEESERASSSPSPSPSPSSPSPPRPPPPVRTPPPLVGESGGAENRADLRRLAAPDLG